MMGRGEDDGVDDGDDNNDGRDKDGSYDGCNCYGDGDGGDGDDDGNRKIELSEGKATGRQAIEKMTYWTRQNARDT